MAAPILPTSAAGLLAAHSLPIPAGGVLVAMKAGLFTPPRLLMVPAGTRLPRGVHTVAVVADPGAAGSGRRGAMRWAVAAAAAPGESGDDDKLQQAADDAFYGALEAKAAKAIQMLNWIEPPHLSGRAQRIKDAMEKAASMAKAKEEDKFSCVKALLLAIYGVIDLAKESAQPKEAAAVDAKGFGIMMLSARVDDNNAMIESVTRALDIAANLLASADD